MKKTLTIVFGIVLFGILAFLGNGVFMIVLGGLSHIFEAPKLALSFWETLLLSVGLSIVGGFFKSTSK